MPGPVSATRMAANISYGRASTVTAPPAGVYFTALSSRLHRASSVHFSSNTASPAASPTVRATPFSAAAGAYWAAARRKRGSSGPGAGCSASRPVSSRLVLTSASTSTPSFSDWASMAAAQSCPAGERGCSASSWE